MFSYGFPKHWSTLRKLLWLKLLQGAAAVVETVTGTLPLTLANALSHAIVSLTRYGLCTQDGTPTPSAPVDIMTNNGALKFGWHDIITTSALSGYGTYVSPSGTAGNRAYKWFKDLPNGTYTFAVDGDYEIIVQWRDPADPSVLVPSSYENLSGWMTSGEVVLDKESGGYGIAVRRTSGTSSITPSNFDGTLHVQEQGIYTDGTPEVLTVRGINLCNPDYYQGDGWYVGANNTVTTSNANGTLVFPCKPNTTYSWWHTAGAGGCRAFELPTDTVTKGQEATWAVGNPAYADKNVIKQCTTSADAKLLCVLFGRDAIAGSRTIAEQLADFMVVEGEVAEATAYEPYVTPQTASVPMLLSVGDYADEGEIISGIKTGKVGVKVFDGTETIGTSNACFTIAISDRVLSKTALLCSHFPYSTKTSTQTDDMTVISFSSTNIGFRYDACATKADFAAWLATQYAAGTPVIVLYPLATETTEQTTAQHLNTVEGTNIVDSVANVGPVEAKVEYMKAA